MMGKVSVIERGEGFQSLNVGMNTGLVSGIPLLTPPPEGGEVLSRTVRRGR